MGSEWREVAIEDLAETVAMGPFGSNIKVETFVDSGIPIVSGQHLKGWRLDDTPGHNFISEQHADRLSKANVMRGDIVLTHAGSVGQVAVIPGNSKYERYVLSQRQFFVRCKRDVVDPDYLVAYFHSRAGRHALLANASQVGVPSLARPVTYLRQLKVPLPPLAEQRRIAHILGTLDDKIELNRLMNETLEEMVRALFKSWFVDFDPVRAKAEGSDTGLPKHLADLFPDRLVDSELGESPEGWQVLPIDDEFRVTIGRTPPRKEAHWFSKEATDVPWVSIRDMGRASAYLHDVAEFLTHDAVSTHRVEVVPAGTVLLSFKLTVGRVSIASRAVATNEAIAHFHPRSADSVGGLYLYSYLKQFDYGTLGNTSSIATAVNSKSVRALPLLRPTAEAETAFASVTGPVFAKMQALDVEARTLADSRDVLLANLFQATSIAR